MTDPSDGLTFLITGDTLGRGDEELGRQLMGKFLQQLAAQSPKPFVVAFYNTGVKLLATDSPWLEGIRALESHGADLIVCGTCVDYFKLREKLGAGRVSDMREIVATALRTARVITV